MGTIVIRLEPAPPGQAGTPTVRLLVDDGSAGWADSPVASRSLPAALPPPPNGLTGADAAESIRDAVLTLDGAGTDVFQRMGRYLFDVLLGDGMQDAWEQASSAPDGPHRVVFDIRVDELVALPWELLEHDDVRPFFGQDVIPSRGRYPFGTPRQAELGPLKVLLVVGSPDDPGLGADAEVCAVHRALAHADTNGRVHLEALYFPSREVLFDELGALQPHILHIVAHGQRVAAGPTFIRFDEPGAGPWELSAADIRNLLPWAPPVVITAAIRPT